jgi:hypothetical protein
VVIGGYDIAWPQCNKTYPTNPAFAVVGVSDGRAFSDNPCFAAEYSWATAAPRAPGVYMNTANPGASSTRWTLQGPKSCGGASDDVGCAYNYGWNAAAHAFAYAAAQGVDASSWWIDVETLNTWSTNTATNNADIRGMLEYLQGVGRDVGVYSTASQWAQITGGLALDVPNWLAGATSASQAVSWCSAQHSFTGGRVTMVQYPSGLFDGDAFC